MLSRPELTITWTNNDTIYWRLSELYMQCRMKHIHVFVLLFFVVTMSPVPVDLCDVHACVRTHTRCESSRLPFIFINMYGVVCVQLAHFSLGDWEDKSIAHVIIIIKSEVSTLPIIIFFRGCVPEMFVTSYFVTYCTYTPGKPGFCFHYMCAVYDECKYSDTCWLADRVRLFVYYTISLSSLYKLI